MQSQLNKGEGEPGHRTKRKLLKSTFLRQCLAVGLLGLALGAGGYWIAKGAANLNFQSWVDKLPEMPDFSKKTMADITFKPGTGDTTDYCFLCGEKTGALSATRPLAVVLDNSAKGRPQAGLLEADVVYEAPVESGLTRLLAIYTHGTAGKIGPVRSTRPYFLSLAAEYTGVQVHSGGSPEALKQITQQKIASLNEMSKASAAAYWRSQQRSRPYNLYSSTERLRAAVEKGKLEKPVSLNGPLFFMPGNGPTEGTPAPALGIAFSKNTKVSYSYDAEQRVYLRQMDGKPHLDGDSEQQLRASNVIVQWVPQKKLDNQGRLELGLIGSGPARVYTQGQWVEAVWSRTEGENKTYFRDSNGLEIPLTPGQTWIEIVSTDISVE